MKSFQVFRSFQFIMVMLLAVVPSLCVTACSSKKIDESNPEELYKEAESDIKDKRYLQAADRLRTIKNKFPYSSIATKAALRLADVGYLEESFLEAAAAYETFRDLHPKYERADYVIFRIGESYYYQLPDGEDRDMSPGVKALDAYAELEKLYPQSEFIPKAKEHSVLTSERLAEKECYVADFYYKREHYDSAVTRYEKIANHFSGTKTEQYAYMRWAEALTHMNKRDEAKHVLETYLGRYPQGKYSDDAKRKIK